MSLQALNPYVVSRKGLFTTNAPQDNGNSSSDQVTFEKRIRKGARPSDQGDDEIQSVDADDEKVDNNDKIKREVSEAMEDMLKRVENGIDGLEPAGNPDVIAFYLNHRIPEEQIIIDMLSELDLTSKKNFNILQIILVRIFKRNQQQREEQHQTEQQDKVNEKPISAVKMTPEMEAKQKTIQADMMLQDNIWEGLEACTFKSIQTIQWMLKFKNDEDKKSDADHVSVASATNKVDSDWTVKTKICHLHDYGFDGSMSDYGFDGSMSDYGFDGSMSDYGFDGSMSDYDCVHVCFTRTETQPNDSPVHEQQNFYLFSKCLPGKYQMHKYLCMSEGVLTNVSMRNIQNHQNKKVTFPQQTVKAYRLKTEMDELTKPDEDGIHYYECLNTTDLGYWHDHALKILEQASPTGLLEREKEQMNKFVFTIANRLFAIPNDKPKYISYNHSAKNHIVEHDDFHVIVRVENSQALIFFCAKELQPDNCVPCTKDKALGVATLQYIRDPRFKPGLV
jgi:hypothetical protein